MDIQLVGATFQQPNILMCSSDMPLSFAVVAALTIAIAGSNDVLADSILVAGANIGCFFWCAIRMPEAGLATNA